MHIPFSFVRPEKAKIKKFNCELFYASVSNYETEEPIVVPVTVKAPFVLFFYTITGSLTAIPHHKDAPDIIIDQGRCMAAFIPIGSHQVLIREGFHSYFYFILKDTIIHSASQKYSYLQPLNQQLISKGLDHRALPLRPIESNTCTLIRQVQHRNAKHVEDQVDNLKTFVDLAIIYSKQIASKLPFQNPEERVREIRQDLITEIKKGKTFNLKSLLSRYSISYRVFLNYFKENYGMRPQDFINQEKMKLAYDLLYKEGMKAKEVSHLLGYSEPATFSTQFKRYFGYSPGEGKRRKPR